MCTLAVLWKSHPAAPLVVAQCRDELLDRPALDVARWTTANGVEVVSGRDVLAGGTWFGVGPRVVAALTNRHDAGGPRRGALSRGDIVVRALEMQSVDEVERFLATLDPNAYGPFSFLACDGDALVYADNAAERVTPRRVPPGVHVLGNKSLDNDADPVVRTVGAAAQALTTADEPALVDGLREMLGRHGAGWPCVHGVPVPMENPPPYGTRSAGVLVWRPQQPGTSRLWTHPSAPHDPSGWRDSTALLR